jgi:hypothetical protein
MQTKQPRFGVRTNNISTSIALNIKNKHGEKILEFILNTIERSTPFKGLSISKNNTPSLQDKWNLVCSFVEQKIEEEVLND